MTLSGLLASDVSKLLNADDFASTVTYVKPDGSTKSITAVVFNERKEEYEQDGVISIRRTLSISFATSGITSLNSRGTFTISGSEWSITPTIDKDDYITSVELVRHELQEQARPDYRLRR